MKGNRAQKSDKKTHSVFWLLKMLSALIILDRAVSHNWQLSWLAGQRVALDPSPFDDARHGTRQEGPWRVWNKYRVQILFFALGTKKTAQPSVSPVTLTSWGFNYCIRDCGPLQQLLAGGLCNESEQTNPKTKKGRKKTKQRPKRNRNSGDQTPNKGKGKTAKKCRFHGAPYSPCWGSFWTMINRQQHWLVLTSLCQEFTATLTTRTRF